jgi:16S rRNA G966 N2-methylase RsmD
MAISKQEQKRSSTAADLHRPVECLGMEFESDDARRQHFLEKLRQKLKDPEFRKIEGFPIGNDEVILAMSDPPYYTACPNPFINQFLASNGNKDSDVHQTEPFVTDVSEGKKTRLYTAHAYHTKVPPRAVMRYIDHYASDGDVVLDFFSGSGMTGLAALLIDAHSKEFLIAGGTNHKRLFTILSELSPAATAITHQYLSRLPSDFDDAASQLIQQVEKEWSWLYATQKPTGTEASYYVWADVFICPECSNSFDFYSVAVDQKRGKILSSFKCPHCDSQVTKRSLTKAMCQVFDPILQRTIEFPQYHLALVSTEGGKDATEFPPDKHDIATVEKARSLTPAFWVPSEEFPKLDRYRRDALRSKGVSHAHHFYMPRNLLALAALFDAISNHEYRVPLTHAFTGILLGVSRLQRYRPKSGFPNMVMSGTLYIGSLVREWNVFHWYMGKVRSLVSADRDKVGMDRTHAIVTTQSSTALQLPEQAVDYIFVDPPFGGNLQYAELNFMYESWLKVKSQVRSDAVVNARQQKGPEEYAGLMRECFQSAYKALKAGRWMTVEFHNSKASVWNIIQEAISSSGFVIADVRILDKQQNTFKQLNNPGSVEKDLVITAYKPPVELETRFESEAGTAEGAWDFVVSHLHQLPIFVGADGKMEVVIERQKYLLYDRMVAFHVQHGASVPLSAMEFYLGLLERFSERDGMYFLPEQAPQYDRKRLSAKEVLQLELFVSDEASAIQWLKQQLTKKPQTFQEIQPQFLREIGGWQKYEKPLELSEILELNFLCYDGDGDVPSQVHGYLSTNFHELRSLGKDDAKLIAKAKNRWYVPDPRKEADLEKIRHRALMKQFDEYRQAKGKLKVIRTEALRVGFKECWQSGDYKTIVKMARQVKDEIIQEDPALLMYYDNAVTRMGG